MLILGNIKEYWAKEYLIAAMYCVIKQVCQTGVIPPDWKKGIILPIYKGKGSPEDCKKLQGLITPINTWEGVCYGSAG